MASTFIVKKPRSARTHKAPPNVDTTGRPTVGQLRLKGAEHVTIVKKDDVDDDDGLEFEPAEIGNVARVNNSQGGYTSSGGEISDTPEGTNVGLDPIDKIWTSR